MDARLMGDRMDHEEYPRQCRDKTMAQLRSRTPRLESKFRAGWDFWTEEP